MVPPASLQQQQRLHPHRRRHSYQAVPLDLFSPPTIRVDAPSPSAKLKAFGTTQMFAKRRPLSTAALHGWLKNVEPVTPSQSPPPPPSSPVKGSRASTRHPSSANHEDEASPCPLSMLANHDERMRSFEDVAERERRLDEIREELSRQHARLALDGRRPRPSPSGDLRQQTLKKGMWKGFKQKMASSVSLVNLASLAAPSRRGSKLIVKKQDIVGPFPLDERATADLSTLKRSQTYATFSGIPRSSAYHSLASRPVGARSSIVQPRPVTSFEPMTEDHASNRASTGLPRSSSGPMLSERASLYLSDHRNPRSAVYIDEPPVQRPRPKHVRSGSTFSISSLLRKGDKSKSKEDDEAPSSIPLYPSTPSYAGIGKGRPSTAYEPYARADGTGEKTTIPRSASGPIPRVGCCHCGGPGPVSAAHDDTSTTPAAAAPVPASVADKYMESLFAAIERRLSDANKSDSSGETVTEGNPRKFSLSPEATPAPAPVIMNFYPPVSAGSLEVPNVNHTTARGRYDAELEMMNRSARFVHEKRARNRMQKEWMQQTYYA